MTRTVEAPGVILARCNPYGHTTGRGGARGPKHLLGGLYGPEYEGEIKWECRNPADGTYRMTCECEHRGQEMLLCYEHVRMIGKRQAGICPPCVMPPEARELHEAIGRARTDVLRLTGMPGISRDYLLAAIGRENDLSTAMTELYLRGIIHRCPLTLTEIS